MCYSCCLFFTYRYRSCSFRFLPSFHSFFSLCFFCDEWCLYVSLLPFVFNVFSHVYCVVLVFICSNRILCFIIALCVCQLMPMCFHVVVALLNLECPLWLYIYIYICIIYIPLYMLCKYTHTFPFLVTIRSSSIFFSCSIHLPFMFLSFPFLSFHVLSCFFPFFKEEDTCLLLTEVPNKSYRTTFPVFSCFSGHVSDFFPTNLQKKKSGYTIFLSF